MNRKHKKNGCNSRKKFSQSGNVEIPFSVESKTIILMLLENQVRQKRQNFFDCDKFRYVYSFRVIYATKFPQTNEDKDKYLHTNI